MLKPPFRAAWPLLACLLLPACGSVDLWPFGGEKARELSRAPANATEYQCAGGKRFFVRPLEGAAWVILPEREFRLDKVAGGDGSRYGNGIAVLELGGGEASLTDRAAIAYAGCKAAGAQTN